jgi:hypothetical protein
LAKTFRTSRVAMTPRSSTKSKCCGCKRFCPTSEISAASVGRHPRGMWAWFSASLLWLRMCMIDAEASKRRVDKILSINDLRWRRPKKLPGTDAAFRVPNWNSPTRANWFAPQSCSSIRDAARGCSNFQWVATMIRKRPHGSGAFRERRPQQPISQATFFQRHDLPWCGITSVCASAAWRWPEQTTAWRWPGQ